MLTNAQNAKATADANLTAAKAATAPKTTDREAKQSALEAAAANVKTAGNALAATITPGSAGLPIFANNGKSNVEVTEGDISGNINIDANVAVAMTSTITAALLPTTGDVMSTRIGHATADLIQNVGAATGSTTGKTWDAGDVTVNQANIIGADININTLAFAQTSAITAGLVPVEGNTALTRVGHGGEAVIETGSGGSGAAGEDSTFGGDIIVNIGSIWDGVVGNTNSQGNIDSYYGNELDTATDSGVDITIQNASGGAIGAFAQTATTTAALSPAVANNSQAEIGHGATVWGQTGYGGTGANAASGGRGGDIDIDQRTKAVHEQEGNITGYDVANGIRGDIAVDTVEYAQTVANTAALSPATHNTDIATIGHGVDFALYTGSGALLGGGGDANGLAKVADGGRGGDITVNLGDAYMEGDIDVNAKGLVKGIVISATSTNALSPVVENLLDAGIGHDSRIFSKSGNGSVGGSGNKLTSAQGGRGGDIHVSHFEITDRSKFGTSVTSDTITIGATPVTPYTATGAEHNGNSDITVFSAGPTAGLTISSQITDALTNGLGDDLYTGIGHHIRLAGEGGIGAAGGSASDAFDDSDKLVGKNENFVVGKDADGNDITVSLLDRYERDVNKDGTPETYVKIIREAGTGKVLSYQDENGRTIVNVIRDSSGNIIGYTDEYDNSIAKGSNGTFVDSYGRTINVTLDQYGLATAGSITAEDNTGQNGNGDQAILNDEKFQVLFLQDGQSADVQPDVSGGRGGDVSLANGDITGDIVVDVTSGIPLGTNILTGTGNAGDSKVVAGIGHSTDVLAVLQKGGDAGSLTHSNGGILAHNIDSAFKIRLLDGNDDDKFNTAKDGNGANYDAVGVLVDDEDGSDKTNPTGEKKALTLSELFSPANAGNNPENGEGRGVDLNIASYDDNGTTADTAGFKNSDGTFVDAVDSTGAANPDGIPDYLQDDTHNQDIRAAGVNPNNTTQGRNAALTDVDNNLFATDALGVANQAISQVDKAVMIYDANGNPQFIQVKDLGTDGTGSDVFYVANTADNRAIIDQNTQNSGGSRYAIVAADQDKEVFNSNAYSNGTTTISQFTYDDSYARDGNGSLVTSVDLKAASIIGRNWSLNPNYNYTQDGDRQAVFADLDNTSSNGNIDLADFNADGKFDVVDVDQDGKLDRIDGRVAFNGEDPQTDQRPDYEVVTGRKYDPSKPNGGWDLTKFARADGGRGGDGLGVVGVTTGDIWVDSHNGTITVSNILADTNVTSGTLPNDYHEARIGHGAIQIVDGAGHSVAGQNSTRNVAGRVGFVPVLTKADGGNAGTGAIIANGGRGGDMTSILGGVNANAGGELDHSVGDVHINDTRRYALVDKNGAYVYDRNGKLIERDIRFVDKSATRQAKIRQRFADELQSKTGAGKEYADGNDLLGIGSLKSVDRDSKGNVIQYAVDENGNYVQVRLNGDINVIGDNDNAIWRASTTNTWNKDGNADNGNEALRTDDDNTKEGDIVLDKILDANGNPIDDSSTNSRKAILDRYVDDWELRKLDRDGIGGYDNIAEIKGLDANADGVPDSAVDSNNDGLLDSYTTYDVNGDNTADTLIPHPTIANAYLVDTNGDGVADPVDVDGKGAANPAGSDGIGYVYYKDNSAKGGYVGIVNYGDDDNVANNYDLEAGQDIAGKVDKVNVRHLSESDLITLNRNSNTGVLNNNGTTNLSPNEVKGRVTFSGTGKIYNADNRAAVKASNPNSRDLFFDKDGNLTDVNGNLAWKAIYQTTDAQGLIVDSSDKLPNLGKSLEIFSEATARVGHGGRSITLGGNGGNGAASAITEIANGGRAGDVNSDARQLKGEITVRTGLTAGITLNTSNVPGLGSLEDQDVFIAQIGHGHYSTAATNKGGDGADGQKEGNGGRGGDARSHQGGAIDADILIDTHTFSTGPATVSLSALNLVGGENIMRTMIGHGDINMASTATAVQNAFGNFQNTQYLMNGQGGAGAAIDVSTDQFNGEANGGRGGDAIAISEGYVGDVTMNLAPGAALGVPSAPNTVPGVSSLGPALVVTSVVGNVLPVDTPAPRNHILAAVGHGAYSTVDSGKGGDASLASAATAGVDRNGGRGGNAVSVIADNGTGRSVDGRENLDHGVNDTNGSDLTINLYDATLGALSPDVHDLDDHVENQRINDVTNIGTDNAKDSSNIKNNTGSLQVGDVNLQIGDLSENYDTRYRVNRNNNDLLQRNTLNGFEEQIYDPADPRYKDVLGNEKVELPNTVNGITIGGNGQDINQNVPIEQEDNQSSQVKLVEDNGTADKGLDSQIRGDLPTNNGDANNLYADRDNTAGVVTYDVNLDNQPTDPAKGGGSSKTNGPAIGAGFDGVLVQSFSGFGENSKPSEANDVGRSVDHNTAMIGHHGFNRADSTAAIGGSVLGGVEASTANGGDGGDAVARTGQINGDVNISNTVYLDELYRNLELLLKTENILNDETYREVARLAGVDTETVNGHIRLKDSFSFGMLINRDRNGEYADANNDLSSQGQLAQNLDKVISLIKSDEHVVNRYADRTDLGGANDPYPERAGHRYVETRNKIIDRLVDRAKVDFDTATAASVTVISSSDGATVIPEDNLHRADSRIGHQVANEAIAQNIGGSTAATATISAQGGDAGDAKGLQGRASGDINVQVEGSIDVLALNAGAQAIQGVNVATIGHRQENDVRAANATIGGVGGLGGQINDNGVANGNTNWQIGVGNTIENAQSQKATDEQTASTTATGIVTSNVIPDTTLEATYQALLEFKTYKDGGDSNKQAWNKLSDAEQQLIEFITGDPTRDDYISNNYPSGNVVPNSTDNSIDKKANGRLDIVDRALFDPNTKDSSGQTRGDFLDSANHRGYFQGKTAELDAFLDRLVVGTRDSDPDTRNVANLDDATLGKAAAKESIKAIMAAGGDGGDAISDQQGASGNITLSARGALPSVLGGLSAAVNKGGAGINIVAQNTSAQSALNSAFVGVGHEQEVLKTASGKAGAGNGAVGIGGDGGDAVVNQGSLEGEINLFSGNQVTVSTFSIGGQNPEVQLEANVGHRQEIGTQRNTRYGIDTPNVNRIVTAGAGATGYANGNGGDALITQREIAGDINLKTSDYFNLNTGASQSAGSIKVVTSVAEGQSAYIQADTHIGHDFAIHSAKAGDAGTGAGIGLAGVVEGNGGDVYITQGTDGVAIASGITLEAKDSTYVANNVVNGQTAYIQTRTLIGHESTAGEEWGEVATPTPFTLKAKITAGNGGDTIPEKSNVTTHEDADGGNITASFGKIDGDLTGRAQTGNVSVVTNTLGGTNGITYAETELGHQRRFTAVSGDAATTTAGDGGNIDIGRGEIAGDILLEALGQDNGTNAVIVNTLNTVGAGVPTFATTLVGHGEFMDVTSGVSGQGAVNGSEGNLIALLEKVENNVADGEGGIHDSVGDAANGVAAISGGLPDTTGTGVAAGDDLDPYEVTKQQAIDRITARVQAEGDARGDDQATIDTAIANAIAAEITTTNDNSITVADANEAYFAMQELLNKVKLAERYPDRLSVEDQQHLATQRADIETALSTLTAARNAYLTGTGTEVDFVATARTTSHTTITAYNSAKLAFAGADANSVLSDHADAGDITYTNNVKLTDHSQNLLLDHEQKGQYVADVTSNTLSTGRVAGNISAHAGHDDFGAFQPQISGGKIVRAKLDVDGDLTTTDPQVLAANEVILDENGNIIAREGDTVTAALDGKIIYTKVPNGIINPAKTGDEVDLAYSDTDNTGIISVTAMSAGLPGVIWTETELGHRRTNANVSGANSGGESGNGGDISIDNTTLGDVNLKADLVNLESNTTVLGAGITELHLGHDVGKNSIGGVSGDAAYLVESGLLHGGLGLGISNTAGKSAAAAKIGNGGRIHTAQHVGDDPLTTATEQANINIDANHLGTLPASSVALVPTAVAAALDPTGIADAAHKVADTALLAAENLPLLTAGAIGAETVTLDIGHQAREVSSSKGDDSSEYSNRAGAVDTAQILNGDINVSLDLDEDGKFNDLTIATIDAGVNSTTNFGHTAEQKADSDKATAGDEVSSKQTVKGDINFSNIEDLVISNIQTLLTSNTYIGHDAINSAESGKMGTGFGGKVVAEQLVDGQIGMIVERSVSLSQASVLGIPSELRIGHDAKQIAKSANDKANDAGDALRSGNVDQDNTSGNIADPVGEFAVQNDVDVDANQTVKGDLGIFSSEISVSNTSVIAASLHYGHTAEQTALTNKDGHVNANTTIGSSNDDGIEWVTFNPDFLGAPNDTSINPSIKGDINISQASIALSDLHVGHDSTSKVAEGTNNGSVNSVQSIDAPFLLTSYRNIGIKDIGVADTIQVGHRIAETSTTNSLDSVQDNANYDNHQSSIKQLTVDRANFDEISVFTGDNFEATAAAGTTVQVGHSSPKATNFAKNTISEQQLAGDINFEIGTLDNIPSSLVTSAFADLPAGALALLPQAFRDSIVAGQLSALNGGKGNEDANGSINNSATDGGDDMLLDGTAGGIVLVGHDHTSDTEGAKNEVQISSGDVIIRVGGDLHVKASQIGHKEYVSSAIKVSKANAAFDKTTGTTATVRNRIQGNTYIGVSENSPLEDTNVAPDALLLDANAKVNSGYRDRDADGLIAASPKGELRFYTPSQQNVNVDPGAKLNDSNASDIASDDTLDRGSDPSAAGSPDTIISKDGDNGDVTYSVVTEVKVGTDGLLDSVVRETRTASNPGHEQEFALFGQGGYSVRSYGQATLPGYISSFGVSGTVTTVDDIEGEGNYVFYYEKNPAIDTPKLTVIRKEVEVVNEEEPPVIAEFTDAGEYSVNSGVGVADLQLGTGSVISGGSIGAHLGFNVGTGGTDGANGTKSPVSAQRVLNNIRKKLRKNQATIKKSVPAGASLEKRLLPNQVKQQFAKVTPLTNPGYGGKVKTDVATTRFGSSFEVAKVNSDLNPNLDAKQSKRFTSRIMSKLRSIFA